MEVKKWKKPYDAYIAWPKNKKHSFEKIITIGEGVCLHGVTERPTQRQSNKVLKRST